MAAAMPRRGRLAMNFRDRKTDPRQEPAEDDIKVNLEMLRKMISGEGPPLTHKAIIAAAKSHGGVKVVETFCKQAEKGVKIGSREWNLGLSTMAATRQERFDPKIALRAVSEMKKANLKPEPQATANVMFGLALSREPKHALDVLSWAKSNGLKHEEKIWFSLMRAYGRSNLIDDAINVIEMMSKEGVKPAENMYSYAVSILSRHHRLDEAEKIREHMEANGVRQGLVFLNAMMGAYNNNKKPEKALQIRKEFEQSYPHEVSISTYNHMIKAYKLLEQPEAIVELYENMKRRKILGDAITTSAVVQAKGKLGDIKGARFDATAAFRRGEGDIAIKNALIEAFMQNDRFDMAEHELHDIYRRKRKPNIITYNCIIAGCVRLGRFDDALKMFEKVKHEGLSPDAQTYNSMVLMLVKQGDIGGARVMIERMVSDEVQPTLVTYNTLLGGYAKDAAHGGDIGQVLRIYKEALEKGIIPNERTYTVIMKAYAGKDDSDGINKVFQDMQSCGITPGAQGYNILITTYGRRGLEKEATKCFATMQQKGIAPTVVTYNALISAFVKSRNVDAAFAAVQEMVASGLKPDTTTVATIVDGLIQQDALHEETDRASVSSHADRAYKLMNEFEVTPDGGLCHSFVRVYVQSDAIQRAFDCFKTMNGKGVRMKAYSGTVNLLMSTYLERNKPEIAVKVYDLARKHNAEANELNLILLARAYTSLGNRELLESVPTEARKRKVDGGARLLGELIRSNLRLGEVDAAYKLVLEVEMDQEIERDAVLITNMMEVQAARGDLEATQLLWISFEELGLEPLPRAVSSIFSAAGKVRDANKVQSFLQHLSRRKLQLTEENYVRVIEAFVRSGKFVEAMKFLNEMLQRIPKLSRSVDDFRIISEALADAGQQLLRKRVENTFARGYPEVLHASEGSSVSSLELQSSKNLSPTFEGSQADIFGQQMRIKRKDRIVAPPASASVTQDTPRHLHVRESGRRSERAVRVEEAGRLVRDRNELQDGRWKQRGRPEQVGTGDDQDGAQERHKRRVESNRRSEYGTRQGRDKRGDQNRRPEQVPWATREGRSGRVENTKDLRQRRGEAEDRSNIEGSEAKVHTRVRSVHRQEVPSILREKAPAGTDFFETSTAEEESFSRERRRSPSPKKPASPSESLQAESPQSKHNPSPQRRPSLATSMRKRRLGSIRRRSADS